MSDTRACPQCAAPLAPGARFCSSCGHAITLTSNEERRVVTVLFADLVGFTGLAEQMDPEQVKRLVDGAFEQLVEDVAAFGGRVDKVLGDGILALFGAPIAHEDDAERAVRAGLRMQQSLAAYVERANPDVPLQMRIGINTGEVLVGTLAGSDYTAMGDVVNIASRIQSDAPPGGVLVGESTHSLTFEVISYGDPVTLVPRGREQKVTTWLASDTLAPPGSRNRRMDLQLVGRVAELSLIEAALVMALGESRSLLLNVTGESGVGKTKLIDEFLGAMTDDVMVLSGVCAPYGESNVWSPIAQAVASHLGLDPALGPEELRDGAIARAAALFGVDIDNAEVARVVEVFIHLSGQPSALDGLEVSNLRDTVHRAITQVIQRRSAKGPVVLWIDDLHWADQVVLDLVEQLATSCSRLPFIVVTSMRASGEVAWPPSNDRITMVSLHLQPLAREESDELALELLLEHSDGADADQRLLDRLFDRSGGNPLFLQELAALVSDEVPPEDLPDSLRALIAARLDQLAPAERQIIDNAAVLGVSGTLVGLERFAKATEQDHDPMLVAALDAKGYLRIEGRRWEFRSESVREAAYQMLTKASRAQRHAGVASFMAKMAPVPLDDLAHHAATAAELVGELGTVDLVPASIRKDAIKWLEAAAERARETGSPRLVVRHASRAIALMSGHLEDESQMFKLQLVRAAGFIDLRDYAHALADIELVLAAAVERKVDVLEGDARALLGSLHQLDGDREAARVELGRAVELLRAADAPVLLAGALRQRGFIELFGGSPVDAEWFFGEAEGVYRSLGDERGLAYVEQHRAWLAFLSGDLQLADDRLHRAADTLNRLGDRNGVGWAFGLLAFVRFFQRRFDEAEDLAVIVRAEAFDRGDDWAAAMMLTLLADLKLWRGDLEKAASLAEQARQRFRRLGDKFGLVQALAPLLRVQTALGKQAGSQRTSEELLVLAESSPMGAMPLLAVAGAAMHRGDAHSVISHTDRAIDETPFANASSYEIFVLRAIAFAQLGEVDEALVTIDGLRADDLDHPFAKAASALVHALAGEPERALSEAESVVNTPGSTYLDRAIAALAGAGAHAALGNRDEADATLRTALDDCLRIGDVVASAFLTLAMERVLGEPAASGSGEPSEAGAGWCAVVEALPSLVPSA